MSHGTREPVRHVGKYELGRTLGAGSFAKVKFARNTETGESVAVKVVDKEKILKHKMVEQIKREISIMKLVRHPNVVTLHEVLASRLKIYIVLEFVSGGELFDKIAHEGKLEEKEGRKFFQQLVDAVDFCHSKGVYHRDLKPENMLLDASGNLKISDFGLSALPQQVRDDGLLHTTCGTPNYVSPEVLKDRGYDGEKADIWSCGVILFVLLAGFLPFDEPDLATLYRKIQKADFKCPTWFSQPVRKLIIQILDPNPQTRPKFSHIRKSEWFSKDYVPAQPYPEEEGANLDDIIAVFNNSEDHEIQEVKGEKEEEMVSHPEFMNAFELITMSQGLNLGALFEKRKDLVRRQTRFTSSMDADVIMKKLEQAANGLGFKAQRRGFKMKLEGKAQGRSGVLTAVIQVFEMAPKLYMVELQKTNGNIFEYHKFFKALYRSVQDIVMNGPEDILVPFSRGE
eukprot:TRINITY_DN1669_c0_g1_i1.p1 TRINITY_DN1669_c0_g1~~TRINITY_DN1669_c0_g1_i1.p1  ORF type:complete len:455 (+),score=105.47 TRINITY_DN1669_c0_g1_i1:157-1521(+)